MSALVGALLGMGACSGTDPTAAPGIPCGADQPACPAGTTCWPANASAALECLPSDEAGTFGASCDQKIGRATCADGLACDQVGPEAGACTYYCDPNGTPCPQGFACYVTNVGGSSGPRSDICRAAPDAGPFPVEEGGAIQAIPDAFFPVDGDGTIVVSSDGGQGGGVGR